MQSRYFFKLVALTLVAGLLLAACGTAQPKTYTIGIVDPFGIDAAIEGFKTGLTELGYTEGQNITYVVVDKSAGAEAMQAAVQDMVDKKQVNLLLAVGTQGGQIAQKATADSKIPVVFVAIADPIAAGLVQDLAKPGGNITGVASAAKGSTNEGVRLEWLVKIAPAIKRVYLPHSSTPAVLPKVQLLQTVASKLGLELILEQFEAKEKMQAAAQSLPAQADGLFTLSDPLINVPTAQAFAQAAIERRMPYSAPSIEYGALVAYAPDLKAMGKQTARLANLILKGARPADLPVETPEFFLAINMKTAAAIGLEIPDDILRQAQIIVR